MVPVISSVRVVLQSVTVVDEQVEEDDSFEVEVGCPEEEGS